MKSMKTLNIKRLIPSKNVLKKKLYHIIALVGTSPLIVNPLITKLTFSLTR